MQVRVKKGHYDAEGNQILGETGAPSRNHAPYLYGRVLFPPGEILDLPDEVARKELAILPQVLEPLSDYKRRKAVYRERQQEAQQFDRDAFARKVEELEAQTHAAARMRERLAEREREINGQRAVLSDKERREQELQAELQRTQDATRRLEADLAAAAVARAKAEEAAAEMQRLLEQARAQAQPQALAAALVQSATPAAPAEAPKGKKGAAQSAASE